VNSMMRHGSRPIRSDLQSLSSHKMLFYEISQV
jgi:hypothetical protein